MKHTESFNAVKEIVEAQFQTVEFIVDLSTGNIVENVAILLIEMCLCFQNDIHIFYDENI